MFEQKSCFAPELCEQKSCFAPKMCEQKSCFASEMIEKNMGLSFNTLIPNFSDHPKDSVELSIEACLQFELYGEYPLSDCNQRDFDQKVRGAFKLPVKYVEYELVKNINL